jgi:1-phosphatidylinositol-3-phosphate 5-kinase
MDTRFLAAQSVMDYSLLLGLDKAQKELVVGIVDSIGSYDLWKTIESKGKLLTRGGEVTVVSTSSDQSASVSSRDRFHLANTRIGSRPLSTSIS